MAWPYGDPGVNKTPYILAAFKERGQVIKPLKGAYDCYLIIYCDEITGEIDNGKDVLQEL